VSKSVSNAAGGSSKDHVVQQGVEVGTQISEVAKAIGNEIIGQPIKSDDVTAKKTLEKIEETIKRSKTTELKPLKATKFKPLVATPVNATAVELKGKSDNAAKLTDENKTNTLADIAKNAGTEKVVTSQADVKPETQQKTTGRPDSLISHNNKIIATDSGLGTVQNNTPATTSDVAQVQNVIAAHNIDGKGTEVAKTENLIQQNTEAKHQPAAEQVGMKIAHAVKTGDTKITIQLEPHNLGKVEIKMEVPHEGRASVVVLADRQDTLHTLQKDAITLEKALQGSGLSTDSGSLSFGLKGGNGGQFAKEGSNAYSHLNNMLGDDAERELAVNNNGEYRTYQSDKVLDISV